MKKLMKKILKSAYNMLPWGGKRAIDEACFDYLGYANTISILAEKHNIRSLKINGDYGLIEGSPHDLAILPSYVKTGTWSKGTNDLFLNFFKEKGGGTYIDIGANIGLTTIPIAQNPDVQCYCFEPEPTNYSFLIQNIKQNCPHGNVITKNIALFNEISQLAFELSPINYGDHRIKLKEGVDTLGENTWQTIEIEAKPLDNVIQGIDGPLAVKIDVQGAEPFVISGGEKLLSKVDFMIIEFSPYWMTRMGSNPHTIIKYISSFTQVKMADPNSFEGTTYSGDEIEAKLTEIIDNIDNYPVRCYWDLMAWNQ